MSSISPDNRMRMFRHYGVDLGTRNIRIVRIETEYDTKSMKIESTKVVSTKVESLTDPSGARAIFNGMQYIGLPTNTDNTDVDPRSRYNKRRLGNSCVRSKPCITMDGSEFGTTAVWMSDAIEMGSTKGEYTLTVPLYASMISVLSLVKNLISKDMTGIVCGHRVTFSMSSAISPTSRHRYRSLIQTLFSNNDPDINIDMDFILTDYALCFNYADMKETKDAKVITTATQYTMIIDASHSQTQLIVLNMNTTDCLNIAHRACFEVSGKALDALLVDEVCKQVMTQLTDIDKNVLITQYIFAESSIIEKIKHDLSMYEVCETSLDIGDKTVRLKISRNSIEMRSESELQYQIVDLMSKYSIKSIELAGGFSRSFVIQDILRNITSGTSSVIVRKAMTADDAIARGAALYSVYTSKHPAEKIDLVRWMKQNNDAIYIDSLQSLASNSGDGIRKHQIGYVKTTKGTTQNDSMTVDATNDKLKMEHDCLTYTIRVKRDVKSVFELSSNQRFEVVLSIDMLDLLSFKGVWDKGAGNDKPVPYYVQYGTDPSYEEFEHVLAEYKVTEPVFEKYADLHSRIGDIFNKMEEFYFDKQGYSTKKLSILEEISRLKSSYTYSTNEVDRFESDYKKLLDAYEFCRIVTVDPDLLDSDTYKRDPEVVIDDRLNRSIIYQLIQEEQGLAMIEQMMRNF